MDPDISTYTKKLLNSGLDATSEQDVCRDYSFDGLKIAFLPEAVIRIREEQEIPKVLELANEDLVPITVRGAGSTLTGGATPLRGGWVLDVSALNKISIDRIERTATVQCGAVVKDIQDAAYNVGLFYPPDPSSHRWSTIGGNVACNAGGLRCVKYGVTRDYVLSLEGYLPTGEKVEWGKATRKFATGYNIRDLWIGSEGTLGIVTRATLKLIEMPEARKTILVGFSNEAQAINSAIKLLSETITPSIMEFIDVLSVQGAERVVGKPFFQGLQNPAVVLVEVDGETDAVAKKQEFLIDWARKYGDAHQFSVNDAHAEELWQVRRKCSGAMFALGKRKLNEDIVLPIQKMAEFLQFIAGLRKSTEIPIAVFGHAGDGNLHVNIMYDDEDVKMSKNAEIALDRVMRKVVELGGAISGEHGVGLAKSSFMNYQFEEIQLDVMKAIKKLFDPNDILNPGKIFEPFSPWLHPKVTHEFPWDHKNLSVE